MMFEKKVIDWLIEDDNPAVAYRTYTELLNQKSDNSHAKKWAFQILPENWYETKGLWYRYYITALAESGLMANDIEKKHILPALEELDNSFDCNCGDFMLLRALVKMGYQDELVIQQIIDDLSIHLLPDSGFLCLHRTRKLKYTPKSCYKDNLHALLSFAECYKRNIIVGSVKHFMNYFFIHNIFYRSTDHSTLILNCREGWRTIDTFFPFEVMRIGLH